MFAHIHTNRFIGFKEPSSANALQDWLFNSKHPLRPLVGWFYRLIVLLWGFMVILVFTVWLGTRLLYPQPAFHLDDLSDYEVFMPGQTAHPEDDSFDMMSHNSRPEEMNLGISHMNSFILSPTKHMELVIIDIPYQQTLITRFSFYSDTIQFHDLLWRWGRPDYKQKNVQQHVWSVKWVKSQFTVFIVCHELNVNDRIDAVTIMLN